MDQVLVSDEVAREMISRAEGEGRDITAAEFEAITGIPPTGTISLATDDDA